MPCWQAHVKGGKTITLGIWDTAGAEQFQSLSCMYYRQSRAAIVCFDPCSRASFEKLQFWVRCLCLGMMPGSFLRCFCLEALLPPSSD